MGPGTESIGPLPNPLLETFQASHIHQPLFEVVELEQVRPLHQVFLFRDQLPEHVIIDGIPAQQRSRQRLAALPGRQPQHRFQQSLLRRVVDLQHSSLLFSPIHHHFVQLLAHLLQPRQRQVHGNCLSLQLHRDLTHRS